MFSHKRNESLQEATANHESDLQLRSPARRLRGEPSLQRQLGPQEQRGLPSVPPGGGACAPEEQLLEHQCGLPPCRE